MDTTTYAPISHRDRAVLRAVAGGRCRLARDLGGTLLVDGLCFADPFAGSRLRDAGLIVAAAPQTEQVRLTESGRALLGAA